ncbi:hypothetical protein HHK36_016754 [Tetracentron sinense]|uniref:Uncharacterized protein n=1 Tax=Tetracentron sinense TaxID=13715 RepID=A0A834YXQ4_TETSI|nr:hypothetical protein HHK36_016754 [Tetracentron sinense]
MESEEIRSENRARKRRKKDIYNDGVDRPGGSESKRRTRSKAVVGRYVMKEFEGIGIFLGKIVSYSGGLYRVDYEDGDCEDLEGHEAREILVVEGDFDEELSTRKKKLDQLITVDDSKTPSSRSESKAAGAFDEELSTRNNKLDQLITVDDSKTPSSRSESKAVDDFDEELSTRKKKLDQLITVDDSKTPSSRSESRAVGFANCPDKVEASSFKPSSDIEFCSREVIESVGVQLDCDADSSDDSCEYVRVQDSCSEIETPLIPPPQLPPSSGNIGVPEESVSQLFSVYSFLRTFSIQLYLSPFELDNFVGSLNCVVPNTLLDAIHVALLRALRRHLEMLSSDGSELASKCLRRIEWSLLDTLTWPVYLVQYILVMGYTKGPKWKGFYTDVLDREYYTLSVTTKLMILQILCDDVIECAELRAEIDVRENSEVGTDPDGTVIFPLIENGPRRVHPRYSKASACKDPEVVENIAKCHELKLPCDTSSLGSKVTELDANASDVDQDENSDECRLCGMDGTLLCCDGCPSVYHSRCIGLSKVLIPEGLWFCPECKVNSIESTLRIGTGLRGAEIFGIDPYEQVFLGTCNHLLILNTSINAEPSSRYYNQDDIPKVLRLLYSSVQYTASYLGICKGILHYWKIPEDTIISFSEKTETGTYLADVKEFTPSYTLSGKGTHKVLNMVEGENCASSGIENNLENEASCHENGCKEAGFSGTFLNTVGQADIPGLQKNYDITNQQVCPLTDTEFHDLVRTESTVSTGTVMLQVGPSDTTHQGLADRSSVFGLATCTSANCLGANRIHADGMFFPAKNGPLSMFSESKEGKHGISEGDPADNCSYMGAFFKTQAYSNQYILGDVAASAAANLAVLSTEESQVSEANSSSKPRKLMSANVSLQVKAFSSAAIRFFWPNFEKKLMEVPRERCGWCLSCKAPATSKKGCLLNLAASNAMKGASRILGSLRPIKNGEGNLPGISAYILYMEESLRGLIVGPFMMTHYRKHWRKQVEQASACNAIKRLLLEVIPWSYDTTLEENIRLIALSGAWVKLVDDWSDDSSMAQNSMCFVGPTQKRGAGSRRNRKQSATSEVTTDPSHDNSSDFSWWRGGKLSSLIYQKGILPCSMVKRAARQGGSRKISGIFYTEGSDIPKRSRRLAWRAAVEMSKNASQLALQVRYLDLHIKWGELVRPESSFQDGKGSETEASAFRNAVVCDKNSQENKIRYGLSFDNQKHLPSRVMKHVVEVVQNQDGKDKFWLSEIHIPLYLIKDYEKNAEQVPVPSAKKASHKLSNLQRRQLKASRRDILSYLTHKGEKQDKCYCASCQQDVLLWNAVTCNACEGYCHKDCTINSTVHTKEEVEFLTTCNKCYHAAALTLNENSYKSPISQLPLQERGYWSAVTKGARQNGYHQPLESIGIREIHPEMKPPTPHPNSAKGRRGSGYSYGIVWKKKKNNEKNGANFRLSNILLRGKADLDPSRRPLCVLCSKPYNSDLMYICCEACKNWYHADAIQLEETKILDVVGFRCCKCRRKSSPVCPYMDPECRKSYTRSSKQGNTGMDLVSGTIPDQPRGWETTMPVLHTKIDEVIIEDDDPLLFSLERVEQIAEFTSEIGPEWSTAGAQKLPVRRHVKREKDVDEANNCNTAERTLSPQVEWLLPTDGFKDEMLDYEGVSYESMEFEPQTYFSFTELLASEDGQLDPFDASTDISGNWENSTGCGAIPLCNPSEQHGIVTEKDRQKHAVAAEPAVDTVHCQICSLTESAPDLSCSDCTLVRGGKRRISRLFSLARFAATAYCKASARAGDAQCLGGTCFCFKLRLVRVEFSSHLQVEPASASKHTCLGSGDPSNVGYFLGAAQPTFKNSLIYLELDLFNSVNVGSDLPSPLKQLYFYLLYMVYRAASYGLSVSLSSPTMAEAWRS